jgi:hypothetical protein
MLVSAPGRPARPLEQAHADAAVRAWWQAKSDVRARPDMRRGSHRTEALASQGDWESVVLTVPAPVDTLAQCSTTTSSGFPDRRTWWR